MLISNLVKSKLPALYSQESEEDPTVYLKFFNPCGSQSWFLTEYDPEDNMAFGYVDLGEPELGYFSITELEEIVLPMGLKIERDISFEPKHLSEVKKSVTT